MANKASSPLLTALELETAPEQEPTPAPMTKESVCAPAPATKPEAIHPAGYQAPVTDAVAVRRAKWAAAKRAWRALAKGPGALTAAQ